ncbi:MAG: P1 family peptidase, partial [Desulfarculus sp.]|nr:P1 family peptidase [Desulfarculus sp.]
GAGTGALAGGIKGGLGSASEVLENGLTAAACVAVNSLGAVIDPASGLPWELRQEIAGEFGPIARRAVEPPAPPAGQAGANTTIAVVATDATLSKAQAQKLAQMAHDGLGRAIRPAHTMFDGDTIFCLATGKRPLPGESGFFGVGQAEAINQLGRAVADCLSRAITRALVSATSLGGLTAFRDLPARQG